MTITQIRYFLEVAHSHNITQTAKQLYVSQQVISKQIRLLEEDLNVKLFEKKGKTLHLTSAGLLLYNLWNRHASETQSALSEIKLMQANKTTVHLGILDLRHVIDLVIPQMQQLEEHFPNIEFKYFLGDFTSLAHAMRNRDIDMAVTLSTELPVSIPPENMLLLQELQLGIFMNNKHPLTQQESVTVKDLYDQTFYMFDQSISRESDRKILIDCQVHGFEPKKIEYYNTLHNLEFALISGNGVTIGFDIFFQDPAKRLKMFPIETLHGLKAASLVIAWTNANMSAIAELFVASKSELPNEHLT